MANKIEYSRLVFKRSTITGTIPTVPTGDTIDNTWLDTDILIGEGFLNVTDDRFWFRTNNGIVEVDMSGASWSNTYTTGATVAGDTIFFDRTDMLSAYTADLSGLSDLNNYTTGTTVAGDTIFFDTIDSLSAYTADLSGLSDLNNYTTAATITNNTVFYDTIDSLSAYSVDISSALANYLPLTGGELSGGLSGTTLHLSDTTGGAAIEYIGRDANGQIVGATTPALGDYLPLTGGTLTGELTLDAVGSGTPIINLGIDSSGIIVTGTTGGGGGGGDGAFVNNGINTYTGGTAAFQTVNVSGGTFDNITVSGDTVLDELSAVTVSILNSGSTVRNYTDYSGNLIGTGVTNSAIVAGSGNTIANGMSNVFVSGVDIVLTAGQEDDTAYFSNVNVATLLTVNGSTIEPSTGGNYIDVTGSSVVSLTGVPMDISGALSDESTQITTGTKLTMYAPYDFELTGLKGSLTESGSTATFMDVTLNGVTILTTKLGIDANEFHSSTAAAQPVWSASTFAENDKIEFKVNVAGTLAAGAKIYMLGNRTL